MDNTPHSDQPQTPAKAAAKPRKRANHKATHETAGSAGKPTTKKAPATRTRAARPAAAKTAVTRRAAEAAVIEPSVAEIERMIATAAYFLAEKRSFAPGSELDDWLDAEHQIRQTHRVSSVRQ